MLILGLPVRLCECSLLANLLDGEGQKCLPKFLDFAEVLDYSWVFTCLILLANGEVFT